MSATAPSAARFTVVENHIAGPAVIDSERGCLVDNCPDVASAQRLSAALDELLVSGDLTWALPVFDACSQIEQQRIARYLALLARQA